MAKLVRKRAATSDLEILYPERAVAVRGELWTVREFSLREAARLHEDGRAYAEAFGRGAPDLRRACLLIGAACGRDPLEVAGVSEPEFAALREAFEALNLALFNQAERKPTGREPRWRDVYATLLTHGHRLADLGSYTARQITLFYDAAKQVERDASADRVRDVNYGFAGGKPANERIRQLEKRSR